jgi:hypothetical protein
MATPLFGHPLVFVAMTRPSVSYEYVVASCAQVLVDANPPRANAHPVIPQKRNLRRHAEHRRRIKKIPHWRRHTLAQPRG